MQDDLPSTPDVLWSSSLLKFIMREVKFRSSLQVRKLTVLAVNLSVQEMENAEIHPRRWTSNNHNNFRAVSCENAKIPTPKHREELWSHWSAPVDKPWRHIIGKMAHDHQEPSLQLDIPENYNYKVWSLETEVLVKMFTDQVKIQVSIRKQVVPFQIVSSGDSIWSFSAMLCGQSKFYIAYGPWV